jgi:regulator of protease activity HflC (stomatin/prohibitin superfamily)
MNLLRRIFKMNIKTVALLAVSTLSLAACSQVEPGHVGIRVDQYGSNAGVSTESLGVGTYFTGPGTSIYEYPVFTQTYTWTVSKDEGNEKNEEFSFADKSGLTLTGDVAVSYHVDAAKAPILFQKYRMSMESIVAGPMRVAIRDAINNEASNMTVEEIYGPRKAELIARAQANVQKFFAPFGLNIEKLYWASPVRVPESVMRQINQKIANEQAALAAQASVATAEANARAKIAEAEGNAKATQIEANAITSNPQILTQRMIEKWDGHYPTYVGGGMPLPQLKVN